MKCDWEEDDDSPLIQNVQEMARQRSAKRGRPLMEGVKGRQVTIYMRADVEQWVRASADKIGANLSAYINAALRQEIQREAGERGGREEELARVMRGHWD